MLLLENEHGPQADSLLAAGADIDTQTLHLADEAGGIFRVEGEIVTARKSALFKSRPSGLKSLGATYPMPLPLRFMIRSGYFWASFSSAAQRAAPTLACDQKR